VILEMIDFEIAKIIVTITAGVALILALLYHYWTLEDDDE
jgi:hypothetical protein